MADQTNRFNYEIINNRNSMKQIANSISAQIQRALYDSEIND